MAFAFDRRLWFRLQAAVTLVYWAALALLTHMPLDAQNVRPGGIELPPWSDKVFHVVAFGLLGFLLTANYDAYARGVSQGATSGRRAAIVWAVAAVYAAIDEWTQPLTGRHCDPWDWLADVAGTACGILCLRMMFRAAGSASAGN